MRKQIFLSLIIVTCTTFLSAQDLSVPDHILNELHPKRIASNNNLKDSLVFKVVYPDTYDSTKKYPVLLGLSGGNQSKKIVNYCYAAWFKSDYFKDYITILPVNNNDKNLMYHSPDDINNMLNTIKNNFQVTTKDWIIVGTSNGGRATFNFISESPDLFQAGIVAPGVIQDSVKVTNSWKHLKFVLAYGDKETKDWIKGAEKTKNILSKYVDDVQIIVLKDQEHILPIDFDIDIVYRAYFEND